MWADSYFKPLGLQPYIMLGFSHLIAIMNKRWLHKDQHSFSNIDPNKNPSTICSLPTNGVNKMAGCNLPSIAHFWQSLDLVSVFSFLYSNDENGRLGEGSVILLWRVFIAAVFALRCFPPRRWHLKPTFTSAHFPTRSKIYGSKQTLCHEYMRVIYKITEGPFTAGCTCGFHNIGVLIQRLKLQLLQWQLRIMAWVITCN